MMGQREFITIHGIDGTGKTTLARAVCDIFAANGRPVTLFNELTPKLINPFQDHKNDFNALEPEARAFYSLGSKAVESKRIAEALDETGVVKDRWVIDVLADQSHKGAHFPNEVYASLLRPTLAVVLTCEESERMRRMTEERRKPTAEDLIPKIPGTRAQYFEDYLIANVDMSAERKLLLDSTEATPVELAKGIYDGLA